MPLGPGSGGTLWHWQRLANRSAATTASSSRAATTPRKHPFGINVVAADSIREYLKFCGFTRGSLFRPRKQKSAVKLADNAATVTSLYRVVTRYLSMLPNALIEEDGPEGEAIVRCRYSPHTLRATTATILLEAGESIIDVQSLLGHADISTTRLYHKRLKSTHDSASHKLVI